MAGWGFCQSPLEAGSAGWRLDCLLIQPESQVVEHSHVPCAAEAARKAKYQGTVVLYVEKVEPECSALMTADLYLRLLA
jgi:hypothetical protein